MVVWAREGKRLTWINASCGDEGTSISQARNELFRGDSNEESNKYKNITDQCKEASLTPSIGEVSDDNASHGSKGVDRNSHQLCEGGTVTKTLDDRRKE